jgi:hypothetical protein
VTKVILNYKAIIVALFLISSSFFSQTINQTIGLFMNSEQSFNGYTLFSPVSYETTYLINNCGKVINSWESNYKAGMMAYLLEDGCIMRSGKITSKIFQGGGVGGVIEKFSWDGELLWTYTLANDSIHLHHDIEVLSNGNVLAIAWKLHSAESAIARGRNPNNTGVNVWTTYLIEIAPTYPEGGQIIWSWDAWDHVVQNFDENLPFYGNPIDFPEKIDINYAAIGNNSFGARDWLHTNSLDYNADSHQIMISVRGFSEFWIIDHESSGDLQYRWGNPEAYERGTVEDKMLFKQHDCHWIESGLSGAGEVLIYNNGIDRPEGWYSTIDQVKLPQLINGEFPIDENMPYGPVNTEWTYPESLDIDFFSQNISGAQRLQNGNTLICEGAKGHIFEITEIGEKVWEYINPVTIWGAINQGTNPTINSVFQSIRYAPNYEAFIGRNLTAGPEIELNPLPNTCEITYAPTCQGDMNYDYTVTVEDIMIALSEFGCTNCSSDIDGDDSFGISDLLILLSTFGSSC